MKSSLFSKQSFGLLCLFLFGIQVLSAQIHNRQTLISKSTTWDGSNWTNGEPDENIKAIFAANFTSTNDIHALSIEVLDNVVVTVSDNTTLSVINDIIVDKTAKLKLEPIGQLLHKNPNSVNSTIDVVRLTGFIDRHAYTYFCSPVSGQALNLLTDYSVGVGNYNNFGNPNDPGVYAPPLFDKYFTWDDSATPVGYDATILAKGAWLNIPETTLMEPAGKGFIVRGPNSFLLGLGQQWQVKFSGVPHDGNITVPMQGFSYSPFSGAITTPVALTQVDPSPAPLEYQPCANPNYALNLIGNPYPSALDADSFLSHPTNVANLGGAIYLWSHKTPPSSSNPGNGTTPLNYTADDYVTYNLVGGVGTSPSDRPVGKVANCQGFFTKALTSSGAFFNNDMRDSSIATASQQFYRTNGTNMVNPSTKNRFWVSFGGKEILIGYMPQISVPAQTSTPAYTIPASVNGYDKMYDAELFKTAFNTGSELSNRVEFYSMIDAATPCPRLAIQGRQLGTSFNTSDIVYLGFSCPAGSYTISAANLGAEGIFATQYFWLRENNGGNFTYYDIKATPYTFTTTATTNDNTTRFQIVFSLPNLPSVTNNPPICGTVLTAIENTIFTNNVSGVSLFSFEVREGAAFPNGNLIGEFPGNVNPLYPYQFNLNFSPIQPSTTYYIRPASYQIGGQWVYGQTCQVTTPAAPASCIYSPASGTIITSTWNRIDARIISNQFGISATSYRFTATVGGSAFGTPFTTSTPYFSLRQIGANSTHTNTTFTITVETFWNGAWRLCPTPFIITTANVISRQSENGISVFEASTYPNPFDNNFKLDINTSSEEQIQMSVYDMLGRQIESKTIQFVDLDSQEIGTNYTSGVYNVILKQGENMKTLRVIKR